MAETPCSYIWSSLYTVVLITHTFQVRNAFVFSHGSSYRRLSSDAREIFKKRGIWTLRRRNSIDRSAACLLSLQRHVLAFSVPQYASGYFSSQIFNNGNANGESRSLVLEIKKIISLFSRAHRTKVFSPSSVRNTQITHAGQAAVINVRPISRLRRACLGLLGFGSHPVTV